MGPGRGATLARVVIVIATVTALAVPALASPEEDLDAAQRRANKAAEELADSEEELALAEDGVVRAETRVATLDARMATVRDQVRQLAVRQYVEGTRPIARLLRMGDVNQVLRAQQFAHVMAGTSTDSLAQYRADREDLRLELAALERTKETRADALEDLRRRRSEAVDELDRLAAAVEQARSARDRERPAQAAPASERESPPPGPTPEVSSLLTPPATSGARFVAPGHCRPSPAKP